MPEPLSIVTPPLPDRIEPSEVAYQRELVDKIRTEQQGHQTALRYWSEYLAKKYRLGPADSVALDGRITRVDADVSR